MFEIDIDKNYNPEYFQRECIEKLKDFGQRCRPGRCRVAALFGLRRTGKTELLKQYGHHLGAGNVKMFECSPADTIESVSAEIEKWAAKGVKFFFFDEITKLPDFVDFSARLADKYADEGLGIVLTGTDSLSIKFASRSELYDRVVMINTTHIPFIEYAKITGINTYDDYIKHGGVLNKPDEDFVINNKEDANEYIGTAVVANIVNTLRNSSDSLEFGSIGGYSPHDLKQVINKIVEKDSGETELKVLNYAMTKTSIDSPVKKIKEKTNEKIWGRIESLRKDINKKHAGCIYAGDDLSTPVDSSFIRKLTKCLSALDLLVEIPQQLFEKNGGVWRPTPEEDPKHYISQPAIRYFHMEVGREQIYKDEAFSEVTTATKRSISDYYENFILGQIMEESIALDLKYYLKGKGLSFCKAVFADNDAEKSIGEFDLVVFDRTKFEYCAFEIKHSSVFLPGRQDAHLRNSEFRQAADKLFGTRLFSAVVYNGKTQIAENGVVFANVADFLGCLDRYRDISLAMSKLQEMGNSEQATLDTVARVDDPDAPAAGQGNWVSSASQKQNSI